MRSLKQLLNSKLKLEASIEKENEKTIRVMNNIGWGAGMRRTKVSPSFNRLDALHARLNDINSEIDLLNQNEVVRNN
jgi:hypothetical protein